MYFPAKASEVFPKGVWTGQSNIHVSVARHGEAPLPWSNKRLIMKSLLETHFVGSIQRLIMKMCPNMEWLMEPEDFENLLLVDFHRLLHGQSTLETKARLTNPSTGNKFHRITLLPQEDIVGGIRVWIIPIGSNDIQIGFRYRMESLVGESEHAKVRQKAMQQVIEVNDQMIEIKEFVSQETATPVLVEEHIKFD
jgi:hypothetical protein